MKMENPVNVGTVDREPVVKDLFSMEPPLTSYIQNPVKAIRAKCIDCSGGLKKEATYCEAKGCPIWPFRGGKNPFRKERVLTDEQRETMAERLRQAGGRSEDQE
jgi:hypothetical protein